VSIYEIHMSKNATIFNAPIFAASTQPLTLALLVLPHASILEVASTLDPLRSANRHLGREMYRWRVVTPNGQAVPLTCGIELPSSGPLAAAAGADALIVIAGFRQSEVATAPLIRDLARLAPRFAAMGGIDAGAWVLARAGLLNGFKATVHWEDLEDLSSAHSQIEVLPDRYVIDRTRFTAGGAAPAADMMLHLIGLRNGTSLARQVAASFITSPRPANEPQLKPTEATPRLDTRVAAAVAKIEANLDTPMPITAIAQDLNLSPRRLEQLFQENLGMPPAAYALSLRLQAARRMVTDTQHPLAEIALRCGFSSASNLSRAFRAKFGSSPRALR
jgi:transcriptional regulator GlxA family with amidase domain